MSSMRRGNMKHMSSKMRAEARVVSCTFMYCYPGVLGNFNWVDIINRIQ